VKLTSEISAIARDVYVAIYGANVVVLVNEDTVGKVHCFVKIETDDYRMDTGAEADTARELYDDLKLEIEIGVSRADPGAVFDLMSRLNAWYHETYGELQQQLLEIGGDS